MTDNEKWIAAARRISENVDLGNVLDCARLKIWFDAAIDRLEGKDDGLGPQEVPT